MKSCTNKEILAMEEDAKTLARLIAKGDRISIAEGRSLSRILSVFSDVIVKAKKTVK